MSSREVRKLGRKGTMWPISGQHHYRYNVTVNSAPCGDIEGPGWVVCLRIMRGRVSGPYAGISSSLSMKFSCLVIYSTQTPSPNSGSLLGMPNFPLSEPHPRNSLDSKLGQFQGILGPSEPPQGF